jgi:ABC-type branched-subunit amino acid transport system ATPase component
MISGIIGPNGAGKSTLLNAICGLIPVRTGRVIFCGHVVTGAAPHQLARMGLGRSFQGVQFVRGLSAVENVMAGNHLRNRTGLLASLLHDPRYRLGEQESRSEAMQALDTVGVQWAANRRIDELPFGVQKRVDIARAIVSRPTCLLLDEPLAGLSVGEKQEVAQVVKSLIEGSQMSVVLVEHDMRFVNQLCGYVVVLDAGQVIAHGEPAEVLSRPEVTEAYVGKPRGADDGVHE